MTKEFKPVVTFSASNTNNANTKNINVKSKVFYEILKVREKENPFL